RRLESAVAQELSHCLTNAVVAVQRRMRLQGQQSLQVGGRRDLSEWPRKERHEGAQVEKGIGVNGQHACGSSTHRFATKDAQWCQRIVSLSALSNRLRSRVR